MFQLKLSQKIRINILIGVVGLLGSSPSYALAQDVKKRSLTEKN